MADLVTRLGEFQDRFAKFSELFAVFSAKGARLMATVQELLDDLDSVSQKTTEYIAARDAVDVALNAQIADLTAQLAAGAIKQAEFQTGIDAAFAKAEAEKALLTPPTTTVDTSAPVDGAPTP